MIKERLSPGDRLDQGRFEVVRAIKAGGMGAVYEVRDHNLGGKTYALKEMINPGVGTEEQNSARERFISEVQVMMTLRHPNIPRVTASLMHGNSFYFVMELVRGEDLSQRLKEQGEPGLPHDQVVAWALQVLEALDYLHRRVPPVVHRDIKPSNLLLSEEGRVVLIDFGISCVANPGEGLWIGTPGYAPPEQQMGKPEPRSDLYALAATMYNLITGVKPPRDFEFASYESLGLKVDPQLQEVIGQALEPWPDERIQSAAEMSQALKGLRNIQVHLPATHSQDFESSVHHYKAAVLDPALKTIIARYSNECHTRFLPPNLDYLQFVLASPTPFELQIIKDEDLGQIVFREKQGILDARTLGHIDPASPQSEEQTRQILNDYLKDFEDFKNSGDMFFL